jgi:hypothetical protein
MRQGIGPHRTLRLSGNGDFRSFEPAPCRWQMVIRDPPFRSVIQFYQAVVIKENEPSHLAALEKAPTSREQKFLPRLSYSPTNAATCGDRPQVRHPIGCLVLQPGLMSSGSAGPV